MTHPTQNLEAAIVAAGANVAPRITPADVEANIVSEHYFTAADGARYNWLTEDHADFDVREIVQRCEQITLEPLDNDLSGYLTHKFDRAGINVADVLEADALDAIRARLISMPRGGRVSDAVSVCYPLVVNNLVCRALNAAAAVGFPKVDAQVIAGC